MYFNGLIGAPNNPAELDENRTINREIFEANAFFRELNDPTSHMSRVMRAMQRLIAAGRSMLSLTQAAGREPVNSLSLPMMMLTGSKGKS